ncbi:hypothetical protein AYI68_g4580 [Smittium mucronatum]|uniref:Velvet domain-containing protein n=1 Tax=Smittium mucronatum TaxID=133383 RepID=A0A1R0GWP2_9FUNG|nr:hypothetical protein AYI68_g4580 [Smittium mucronatum]
MLEEQEDNLNEFSCSEFIVTANLWSVDMTTPLDMASPHRSLDYDESEWLSSMVMSISGKNVANGVYLQDLDGNMGVFFMFDDISVKKPGEYRIRFGLTRLPVHFSETQSFLSELDHVFSDVLTVYSGKKFPGVLPSSPLSKFFFGQGAAKTYKGRK